MPERVYLITVASHGVTSSFTQRADDLLDAAEKARALQKAGAERISIVLSAFPQTMQDEYRETFSA